MTLHWNSVEVVFCGVSIVVLFVAMYSVWDTTVTQQAARRADERRRNVADTDHGQAWANFAVAVIMLGASIMALFLEPPPPDYSQVPQTVVYTVAWIMAGSVMVYSSVVRVKMQRRLRAEALVAMAAELHATKNHAHES